VRFFAALRMTGSRKRERSTPAQECWSAGVRFFAALRMTGSRKRERSTPAQECWSGVLRCAQNDGLAETRTIYSGAGVLEWGSSLRSE